MANDAYITAITAKVGDEYMEVPIAASSSAVVLNGRSGSYAIFPYALVACEDSVGGSLFTMSPLATSGGTGNKTPNYNAKFPIGCSIYYHPNDTAQASASNFSSKLFYTAYEDVDARYSALFPSSLDLKSGSTSEVFLHVNVVDGYWSPYYKAGLNAEIIVTSNNFASGNYYIYLGKTSSSSNKKFQLESNHPLYYYDGTKLIDYATWIASQNTITITDLWRGDGVTFNMSGAGNITDYNVEFQIPSEFCVPLQSRYTLACFDMHATLRNNGAATTAEYWLEVGYYENGYYVSEEVLGSGQTYLQRGTTSSPVISTVNITGAVIQLTQSTTHVRAHFNSASAINLLSATTGSSKQRASIIRLLAFVPVSN